MKELLKKLKLIDYLHTELIIQQNDFVNKLRNHVDEGSTGIFADTFDVFSSSKNEYKGEVSFNGFKIKRRRKFFDTNMNMAVANWTYSQKEGKLIINTEINGFHGMVIPFYIFCIIIYGAFIVGLLSADKIGGNAPGLALPFIIIHVAFMMGIPYFIMRRGTKRLKHELAREFFYLTK
ncbi:hypothetical protein [Flammeovirga pacifica]|uniref:Uncharacterized protein n=1 Tax=Flammeovirga pacifica TaxID=915059 RepID=A0A1S1YWP2_FLAPC|nr:hypothetical protein [Flammeovirga pacifica]OHX65424.1 hypothetical protein NH26_03210 [Flammeovirga pacifica]